MRFEYKERTAPVPDVGELFRVHHLSLVRLAVLLVGDQASAEDVVQDVYARLQQRRGAAPPPDNLLAYARTSVLNACRNLTRRRALMKRFVEAPTPVWSAGRDVLFADDRRRVLQALTALSGRQREAIVLRYYLDLSEAEIATCMGVSRGTVKSTISRPDRARSPLRGGTMTTGHQHFSEDLLRGALADGATIVAEGQLTPLREPTRRRRLAMGLGTGLLAAVATATAVTVLVVTGAPTDGTPKHRPTDPARAGLTLAAYAGVPYFVGGAQWGGGTAMVYDSRSGKAIANVPGRFWQVAGTGDNSTFLLTTADQKSCRTTVYRLRLGIDGKPARPTAILHATMAGIPTGDQTLTATTGGTALAEVTQSCDDQSRQTLNIIRLDTGTHRTIPLGSGPLTVVLSPTWAPDRRHLAFLRGNGIDHLNLDLMDTATGATTTIARADDLHAPDTELKRTAIVGREAVVLVDNGAQLARLVWFSLANGRITRQVVLHKGHLTDRSLLAASPNGLLIITGDFFFRYDGTRSYALPTPPDPNYLGWTAAW